MALKLTTRTVDGVSVVEAAGRIVLGEETNNLRDSVKALLFDGNTRIVLNLAQVDFVDSSGLGTLVGLHSTAAARGAKLKLAAINRIFRDVLVVTKLLTVFDLYDSEAAAVASFGQGAGA